VAPMPRDGYMQSRSMRTFLKMPPRLSARRLRCGHGGGQGLVGAEDAPAHRPCGGRGRIPVTLGVDPGVTLLRIPKQDKPDVLSTIRGPFRVSASRDQRVAQRLWIVEEQAVQNQAGLLVLSIATHFLGGLGTHRAQDCPHNPKVTGSSPPRFRTSESWWVQRGWFQVGSNPRRPIAMNQQVDSPGPVELSTGCLVVGAGGWPWVGTLNQRVLSRPRVSLDTSLEGMMVLQGGSHEQTQEREEGPGRRGGGRGR
jgi:hypothetical protein